MPIDDENILGRLERIAETTDDYELYVVAFDAAADRRQDIGLGGRPMDGEHRRLAQRCGFR